MSKARLLHSRHTGPGQVAQAAADEQKASLFLINWSLGTLAEILIDTGRKRSIRL